MKQLLSQFLKRKRFLNNGYFRFRPGHSKRDAIRALTLWVDEVLNPSLLPTVSLLDIRLAFDSMHDLILLTKLEHVI